MAAYRFGVPLLLAAALAGCAQSSGPRVPSFGEDLRKLSTNVFTVVLTDNLGRSQIVVVPKYQGRVMTSTAVGAGGPSNGRVNHDAIIGAKTTPKFSTLGGEERLTFGPEGGAYSLFFPGGADFTPENYQVPAALDSEPFDILERAADKITFVKKLSLSNYANKVFQLKVTRTVKLFSEKIAWKELGAGPVDGVSIVGYETANMVSNYSKTPWRKDEGLPSVSTVHTVAAGPDAVAILAGRDQHAPVKFTADYGEPVPFDRLIVSNAGVALRSGATVQKIGISPNSTAGLVGAYDPGTQTLTIVQFMPFAAGGAYNDAHWKIQKDPYAGDAATARVGKDFIELQTFSPALELAGWASATHTARTYHLSGKIELLDSVSRSLLGVSLIGLSK